MASSLSFTPSITHTYNDSGKTLAVVFDYSDFPDYFDFSALTVKITGNSQSSGTTTDLFSSVVTSLSGTATASSGATVITGSGTSFDDDLIVGDYVAFGDDTTHIYKIETITSATSITISSGLSAELTASSIRKYSGTIYYTDSNFGSTSQSTINDDIYTFLYTFTFGGSTDETGSYQIQLALSCNLDCYVQSLIADIPDKYNCKECDNTYLLDVTKIFFYYKALQDSAYNGSVTNYNNILSALCDIKDLTDSNCGC